MDGWMDVDVHMQVQGDIAFQFQIPIRGDMKAVQAGT